MNIIQQPLYKMLAVDDEIIFVVEDTNIVANKVKVKYVGLYEQAIQTVGYAGRIAPGVVISVDEKEYDSYFKTHQEWKIEKTKKAEVKS